MLGLFSARSRSQPRLSVGRGWFAWHNRPRMPALLRARALERPRPDLEGTAFWRHGTGRQSWRRRQRTILLPRLDADTFLPESALQISAGGISLRALGRRKWSARQTCPRV